MEGGRRRQAPIALGDLVDAKYRVESVIGMGGAGVVVRARHDKLGRPVAIKFLRPELLGQPQLVHRFEREARAAARLESEHVVDVLDVGRLPSGEPYIVMELLEGSDLAAYLASRGRLELAEALELFREICEGIAEAHAAGVVHRDLKPQNVFLVHRRDGRRVVKVLDFGVSKVAGDVHLALTGASELIGTPTYMAPEQLLASRDAGVAADVWALGILLYEMLVGQVPFQAGSLPELYVRILRAVPTPLAQLRPDVPPAVAAIVDQCLAKDLSQRIASVEALADALRSATRVVPREHRHSIAGEPTITGRTTNVVLASAAAVIALCGLGLAARSIGSTRTRPSIPLAASSIPSATVAAIPTVAPPAETGEATPPAMPSTTDQHRDPPPPAKPAKKIDDRLQMTR